MNKLQAYRFFLSFIDDAEKIDALFDNFKRSVAGMSKSQFATQSRKILAQLSKLNLDETQNALNILRDHPIYSEFKKKYDEIIRKNDDVKDFIYSHDEIETANDSANYDINQNEEPEAEVKPTKKSKPDIIRSRYNFLEKNIDTAEIDSIIKDAKQLEREVSRLDFEELPEEDYSDMVEIKNSLSKIIKSYQGIEKSEKYGPYLLTPLTELIMDYITLGNKEKADSKAAAILNFIEDPDRIEMFEPAIKRMIAKKMTPKEFRSFHEMVTSLMKDQDKNKFQSFDKYK